MTWVDWLPERGYMILDRFCKQKFFSRNVGDSSTVSVISLVPFCCVPLDAFLVNCEISCQAPPLVDSYANKTIPK